MIIIEFLGNKFCFLTAKSNPLGKNGKTLEVSLKLKEVDYLDLVRRDITDAEKQAEVLKEAWTWT